MPVARVVAMLREGKDWLRNAANEMDQQDGRIKICKAEPYLLMPSSDPK